MSSPNAAPLREVAPIQFGVQFHCETAHQIAGTGGLRRGKDCGAECSSDRADLSRTIVDALPD